MEVVSPYSAEFFAEEGRVAAESAAVVVPWIMEKVAPRNVIDVGCGVGKWCEVFEGAGVHLAYGIDAYAPSTPNINRGTYDFSVHGVNCIDYDLAICLEVAEHLPPESAEPLVAGLAKAGTVLWSAATPGQPGVGHINCQPHDYWHGLFAQHGMTPEFIGDKFDEPVADFYRRNMYLYRRAA